MASPRQSLAAQRQHQARLKAAFVALIAAAILAWAGRGAGHADTGDAWWLRARFTLREKLTPTIPDQDIVLVDIDDRSVNKWKEPLILWGPHLAAAIDRVSKGGAKLIALDWIQTIDVDKYFPGHDEPLITALSRAPNVVMVKEFGADGSEILPLPQLLYALPDAYLDPQAHLGFAEFETTESITTALRPTENFGGKKVETRFATRIAERATTGTGKAIDGMWTTPPGKGRPNLQVYLRPDGSVLINYANGTGKQGKAGAFQHYSLADIAQPSAQPDTRFKNKIVMIGASFKGFNDIQHAPFLAGFAGTRSIPGPEMQANFLRTLLDANPIDEPDTYVMVLWPVLLAAIAITIWRSFSWVVCALITLAIAIGWIALSLAAFIGRDFALPVLLPLGCTLVASVIMGGARALGEERERRQVLGLWGRYQDPRLVEYLMEHPAARGGQGHEAEVTVLFADLKNFTKTVEHLEPAAALQVLNRYLALMTDIIRDEYGGVVDKYLGDGLMAQWGAPEPWDAPLARAEEHHASKAVRACLELQRRSEKLTASIMGDTVISGAGIAGAGIASAGVSGAGARDVTFGLRLTLHTGPVVVGWVGAERIEFTIIGDTVNVCSRLQETAKELGCEMVISESTHRHVAELVQTGKQAEVMIRGRDRPLQVFEVLGESVADREPAQPVSSQK